MSSYRADAPHHAESRRRREPINHADAPIRARRDIGGPPDHQEEQQTALKQKLERTMSDPKGSKSAGGNGEDKTPTYLDPMHDDMYLSPNRQCSAMSRVHGRRCHNRAMVGQRVCRMHGGATKQARAKAAERIRAAQNEAADLLVEFMADPETPRELRTKIAQDLLNRAGVSPTSILQIDKGPSFAEHAAAAIVMDLDVDEDDDPNVIDADVVMEDEPDDYEYAEPPVQNRFDKGAFREVERAALSARSREVAEMRAGTPAEREASLKALERDTAEARREEGDSPEGQMSREQLLLSRERGDTFSSRGKGHKRKGRKS